MALPLWAGAFPFGVALGLLAFGVVVLGAPVFGEAVLGAVEFCSGVPAPGDPCSGFPGVCGVVLGVCGEVPGVCGVVLGVCGAVLGVEVWVPPVWPLCWSELGPDGDVLFGCVWAATQSAEDNSKENSIAFDLMAV
jgi:hypothetical protein